MTTKAHAVMQLNAENGGNRKFIMVKTNEKKLSKKIKIKKVLKILMFDSRCLKQQILILYGLVKI